MHFVSWGSINTKYCPEGNFPYKVISIARKMWLLTFLLSPSLPLSFKYSLGSIVLSDTQGENYRYVYSPLS